MAKQISSEVGWNTRKALVI